MYLAFPFSNCLVATSMLDIAANNGGVERGGIGAVDDGFVSGVVVGVYLIILRERFGWDLLSLVGRHPEGLFLL